MLLLWFKKKIKIKNKKIKKNREICISLLANPCKKLEKINLSALTNLCNKLEKSMQQIWQIQHFGQNGDGVTRQDNVWS